MKPWDIIGWLVIGAIATGIIGPLTIRAIRSLLSTIAWLSSRRIAPRAGQVWIQDGNRLEILEILDNGRVIIRSGCASWGDSPGEWRSRVGSRKLFLEKPEEPR